MEINDLAKKNRRFCEKKIVEKSVIHKKISIKRRFFVLGAAERDTNRSPHNTKQSLITSIMEVFANFSREAVVTACSRVRSRLEEVVAANGDFIH